MLLLQPFLTICLAQVAITAPAPIPSTGPVPLADHPDLGYLSHGISQHVKRLFGLSTRAEVNDYRAYGAYGKYGGYGSYPDISGQVNTQASSEVNAEIAPESLITLTTTMPVLTTTVKLRSMSTPSPTITAVSTTSPAWLLHPFTKVFRLI